MHRPDHPHVIYCLAPRGTPGIVLERLSKHYANADPRVKVIEERRHGVHRGAGAEAIAPPGDRRNGPDRRRRVVPRMLPTLPRTLSVLVDDLAWVQHLVPVGEAMELLDAEALFDAVRARHPEAPSELYWRWYARMHSRLSVLLGSETRADQEVGPAFGRMLDALEDPVTAGAEPEQLMLGAVDAAAVADPEEGIELIAATGPPGGIAITDPRLDEPIELHAPDALWVPRARAERDQLLRLLGRSVVAVEHVGSTAVVGALARPVIDLIAGVEAMPAADEVMRTLAGIGYEDCGDAGVEGRRYLRKRAWQRIDLHIVEHGGALWRDTLALREHLRTDPGRVAAWSAAKRAAQHDAAGSLARYAELRRGALEELLAGARECAHVAG